MGRLNWLWTSFLGSSLRCLSVYRHLCRNRLRFIKRSRAFATTLRRDALLRCMKNSVLSSTARRVWTQIQECRTASRPRRFQSSIVWSSLYDFLVGAKNCLQSTSTWPHFVPLFVNFGVVPVTRVPEPISPYLRASYAPIRDGRWSALGLRSSASSEAVALFDHFAGIESYEEISLELHTASVFQNIEKELCNRFLGFPAISRAHRNCEMSWFSALAAL